MRWRLHVGMKSKIPFFALPWRKHINAKGKKNRAWNFDTKLRQVCFVFRSNVHFLWIAQSRTINEVRTPCPSATRSRCHVPLKISLLKENKTRHYMDARGLTCHIYSKIVTHFSRIFLPLECHKDEGDLLAAVVSQKDEGSRATAVVLESWRYPQTSGRNNNSAKKPRLFRSYGLHQRLPGTEIFGKDYIAGQLQTE